MGIAFSKRPSRTEETPSERIRREKKQLQQELQQYGILVPPIFGIGPYPMLPLSPSSYDRLMHWKYQTSCFEYLHHTDLSYRILNDHMQPTGLWVTANAPFGHIRTSFCTSSLKNAKGAVVDFDNSSSGIGNNDNISNSSAQGQVVGSINGAEHTFFRVGTDGIADINTHIQVLPKRSDLLTLLASVNTKGYGWLGSTMSYTPSSTSHSSLSSSISSNTTTTSSKDGKSRLQIRMGSVFPFHAQQQQQRTIINNQDNNNQKQRSLIPLDVTFSSVQSYVAVVDWLGATAAVETTIPFHSLKPDTKTYFTMDLTSRETDNNNSSGDSIIDQGNYITNTSAASTKVATGTEAMSATGLRSVGTAGSSCASSSSSPPMQITLERTSNMSALALSQVFTLVRDQWNPYEDRAPKVRNTLGWTCRIERHDNNNNDSNNNHDIENQYKTMKESINNNDIMMTNSNTHIVLGGAWQFNRNLALKVKLCPTKHCLDTAVLLKQWQQPRITGSILHRYNYQFNTHSFVGVNVEIESGQQCATQQKQQDSSRSNYYYGPHGPDYTINRVGQPPTANTPETKATLSDYYA